MSVSMLCVIRMVCTAARRTSVYLYIFHFCGQVQGEPVCELSRFHFIIIIFFLFLFSLLYYTTTQLHRPIHSNPIQLALARNRVAAAAGLTHMCWSTSNIYK